MLFIYRKVYPLKVYIVVVISIFIELCSHHHELMLRYFYHPPPNTHKETLGPLLITLHHLLPSYRQSLTYNSSLDFII